MPHGRRRFITPANLIITKVSPNIKAAPTAPYHPLSTLCAGNIQFFTAQAAPNENIDREKKESIHRNMERRDRYE